MRLLILSEQNNPDWASVPLVGYRHSEALAREHQVHLVTHIRNKPAFKMRQNPFKCITYVDLGWVDRVYDWAFRVLFKGDPGSQALTAFRLPFYLIFEWVAWRQLKKKVMNEEFDCVIRLTPVAPVTPSPWSRWLARCNVPFVIGPINGGLPFPAGFQQAERQKEWISNFRKVYQCMPYARSTYKYATAIIAGSSQTCKEFKRYSEKLFFIPENGIAVEMLQAPKSAADACKPLELVFVGRLVPYKACDIAIKGAQKLLKSGRAHLTIVGDGLERPALEKLVFDLGLTNSVFFVGRVPHEVVIEHFKKSDILLFPSVREFGGGVVFEALAVGAVPIVLDYGGPGDTIHSTIGFKIPLECEEHSITFIEKTLENLDGDRLKLLKLSNAGMHHAETFLTWEGKAKLTTTVLEWVLGVKPKPILAPVEKSLD